MTYWLVLFQRDPVPPGAPGPIKMRVKRNEYEVASQDAGATITHQKGTFLIKDKRTFVNEEENSCYIIADVIRKK